MSNFFAEMRKKNFKNIIHKTPLLDFFKYTEDKEHPTIGVQWHGGADDPSRLFGCPDQTYWSAFFIILMFARKRLVIQIRCRKMPYKNYDEFIIWYKARQKKKSLL